MTREMPQKLWEVDNLKLVFAVSQLKYIVYITISILTNEIPVMNRCMKGNKYLEVIT